MLCQVHQSLVLLNSSKLSPEKPGGGGDHSGLGFTVTDFVHPPLWEGYSQCGHMVLGPFGSPSEISQGVSNPRHARLKTVAHSGTEKVGGYVVCNQRCHLSSRSSGAGLQSHFPARMAKSECQTPWRDRWGPSSLGVPLP